MPIVASLALCLFSLAQEAPALSVQAVASADPALEDRWNRVDSVQFEVHQSERVFRGQVFHWRVFFAGYGRDDGGNARLTYSARITRPDGKVYFEGDGLVGWDGPASADVTLLCVQGLGAFFEPADKLGTYRARFEALDAVTGAKAVGETEVELVAYEEGATFAEAEALRTWVFDYAKAPEPERLVPALWSRCAQGGFTAESTAQEVDGFLLEAFEHNGWLLPELVRDWKRRSAEEKRGALALLAAAPEDTAALVKKLPKEDRAALEAAPDEDPRTHPLAGPRDINLLYGRYVAHRSWAPLERLLLALHADGGVISEASTRSKDGIDVPLTRVVPRVVSGMLARLFAYDPLARGYATRWAESDAVPPGVAEALTPLLEEK